MSGSPRSAAEPATGRGVCRRPGTGRRPNQLPMVGRDVALVRLADAYAPRRSTGASRRSAARRASASRAWPRARRAVLAHGGQVIAARAFPAKAPSRTRRRGASAGGPGRGRCRGTPCGRGAGVLGEVVRLVPLPAALAVREGRRAAAPPAARARLLDAVAVVVAALVAGPAPGLVVVEDSNGRTTRRGRRSGTWPGGSAGRPLLLVLTWRGGARRGGCRVRRWRERPPGHGKDHAGPARGTGRGGAGRGGGRRRGRLGRGDLAAESEGLPLYVVEALAAGPGAANEAPRGVRALLRERLASVGETASQVLPRRPSSAGPSTSARCVSPAAGRRTRRSTRSRSWSGGRSSARWTAAASRCSTSATRVSVTPRTRTSGSHGGGCSTGASRRCSGRAAGRIRPASPRSPVMSSQRAGTPRLRTRTGRRAGWRGQCSPTVRRWSTFGRARPRAPGRRRARGGDR